MCRPVQFKFSEESRKITTNEIARMESDIVNLFETTIDLYGRVFHKLLFASIVGKLDETYTNTPSNTVCKLNM